MHYPYLEWLVIFLIAPTAILWFLFHSVMWKYRIGLLLSMAFWLIVGLGWDYYAIHSKIWGWPSTCCALPRVGGLPLEELLFICFSTLFISTITLVVRDIFLTHHWMKKRKSHH